MIIETLHDLGTSENPEATIASLKLENEVLKYRHNEELMEIKKNINTILKDIQKSIHEEREKLIDDTRMACEQETIKRVQEAKLKQWCSNCLNEAYYFCCWNTSYCDFNCQKAHWTKHASECQNSNSNQANVASKPNLQPLLLRPAALSKGFMVPIFSVLCTTTTLIFIVLNITF